MAAIVPLLAWSNWCCTLSFLELLLWVALWPYIVLSPDLLGGGCTHIHLLARARHRARHCSIWNHDNSLCNNYYTLYLCYNYSISACMYVLVDLILCGIVLTTFFSLLSSLWRWWIKANHQTAKFFLLILHYVLALSALILAIWPPNASFCIMTNTSTFQNLFMYPVQFRVSSKVCSYSCSSTIIKLSL